MSFSHSSVAELLQTTSVRPRRPIWTSAAEKQKHSRLFIFIDLIYFSASQTLTFIKHKINKVLLSQVRSGAHAADSRLVRLKRLQNVMTESVSVLMDFLYDDVHRAPCNIKLMNTIIIIQY